MNGINPNRAGSAQSIHSDGLTTRIPRVESLVDPPTYFALLVAPEWHKYADCPEHRSMFDKSFWSESRKFVAEVKGICEGCPVRQECLDSQMEHEQGLGVNSRFGIFGGTTRHERFAMDETA